MKVAEALEGVDRLFLDTAPVIYFVERNPQYFSVMAAMFNRIEHGTPAAVTSPVTLAECLVTPIRQGLAQLEAAFTTRIVSGLNTTFRTIGQSDAQAAADIRARYNLALTNALQVAVALSAGCDALLTNDGNMERVAELKVIIADKLEL